MGVLTVLVAYSVGKRRGRKKASRKSGASVVYNPECANYLSFCQHYGNCAGQTCEPML